MTRAAGDDRLLDRVDAALWIGALAGPVAWLVDLTASYALVPPACRHGTMWPIHVVTVLALAIAAGGTLVGWRARNAVRVRQDAIAAAAVDRVRFMSGLGLSLSGLFGLLVLATAVGAIVHGPCDF